MSAGDSAGVTGRLGSPSRKSAMRSTSWVPSLRNSSEPIANGDTRFSSLSSRSIETSAEFYTKESAGSLLYALRIRTVTRAEGNHTEGNVDSERPHRSEEHTSELQS